MTVLEYDVARSRTESARAADLSARILALGQEIERMTKEESRLAEVCGLEPRDLEAFQYPGLERLLATFQPGMIPRHLATWSKDATVTSLDQVLAVSLVQRQANLRSIADARGERTDLSARRRAAWEAVEQHRATVTEWTGALAQWDPGLRSDLCRMEDEERALLQRQSRLEFAQVAAQDAESALKSLWDALNYAVDWMVPDGAVGESPVPVLRSERLQYAEPWIFEVQVLLGRARRALWGTDDLSRCDFEADLSQFAGWCIDSMGCDGAERDGTSRSSRTVSWTLTTVLAFRGHLTRAEIEVDRALEQLRLRRTRRLSRQA